MTATLEPTATPEATETFDSLNPRTGEVVATHPVHDATQVQEAVDRAHEAARWWAELSFDARRDVLLRWAAEITRRLDELTALSFRENGKPVADAALEVWSDVAPIEELRAVLPDALRLGRLGRAESWRRVAETLAPEDRAEYLGHHQTWLDMLPEPAPVSF